ncbi:MAG TPA: Flp family type IVb pilin [Acidimicrobiia bacterium]|nr:Flp family type IVb pilin [Acidimicrobiia bacterium]
MVIRMWALFVSRLTDEETGASLVEYALLLALIALVAIAAVQLVGSNVSEDFDSIAQSLDSSP